MAADATRTRSRSRRTRSGQPKKSRLGLWTLVVLLLLLATFVGMLWLTDTRLAGEELRLDTFVDLAERGRIDSARILDQDAAVVGRYTDEGGTTHSYHVEYLQSLSRERLVDVVIENRIPTTIDRQFLKSLRTPITGLLGILMLVTVFGYMALSYRSGTGVFNVFSGARQVRPEDAGATFADVAGQGAAIEDMRELVDFLSDPERYAALGAQVPKGVLLYGPPGCGKTLLARALAGEAGASFFSTSGSDFVELHVGVGAARVRDLFREARENAPAIVFIDELDSVGRRRTSGKSGSGSGDEQEQALNQILAEMDGFGPRSGVLIVGASNRPDVLDPALLRPGRVDRTIRLERPKEHERQEILEVHARGKRLAADVDLASVAAQAIGFSGADLANVLNEGALLASRAGKPAIGQAELETAVQRLLRAPERQRRLSLRDRSVGHQYGPDERVAFADVAGLGDIAEEITEIREFLAHPARFADLGVQVPKGVLLDGPPGCGKTLLARALAGEANAAFLYVAATEFVEVYVGEGAARVRDLFAEAQAVAPAIVFIDEVDAIGGRRGASNEGTRERENTLNQILTELDGFDGQAGVIVVAATNRPDMLDPALVRPGRFDRHLTVGLPDRSRRRAILAVHARGKPLAGDVDLDTLAALTPGFSGADLANLLTEAGLLAARRGGAAIAMAEFDDALARAVQGVSSATRSTNEVERAMVAYHEAGHALVGYVLDGAKVPHRLTVIPRGRSLGATWNLETEERSLYTRSLMIDQIAGLLGGRVAEELVFPEPSTGAHNDLERVSLLARRMVTELGMSSALGLYAYPAAEGRAAIYSEEEGRLIHSEIRAILDEAHGRAGTVLRDADTALRTVAEALLERETLSAAQFEALVEGLVARPSGG
ncbi:MAG: AAA family ATPase, partial [Egibacteraceae bacterium]